MTLITSFHLCGEAALHCQKMSQFLLEPSQVLERGFTFSRVNFIKALVHIFLTSNRLKNGTARGSAPDPCLSKTVTHGLDAATACSLNLKMRLSLKWRMAPWGMRLELRIASTNWTSNQEVTRQSSVKARTKRKLRSLRR